MRAIRGFVVVVLAVLVAASCSSDPPPKSDKPSASAKPGKVEVKDVKVGEKITVTIPFESGDVTATFTVVAG